MQNKVEHDVWIPSLHRDLTEGVEVVRVSGERVSDLVDRLEERYPGLRTRLCDGDRLRPQISVAVNGSISQRGLRQLLTQPSEVHFIPAMSGG